MECHLATPNELMDLGNHHQWPLVTSQIETIRHYMPLDKKKYNTLYKVGLQTKNLMININNPLDPTQFTRNTEDKGMLTIQMECNHKVLTVNFYRTNDLISSTN